MRAAWLSLLLLPLPALSGCFSCDASAVDATVTLEPDSLEVRSLPILSSGATKVAGIEVPDSHAHLVFDVDISGGPSEVEVDDLRLTVRVGSTSVPGVLRMVASGDEWRESSRGWDGDVRDGGVLELWWAVDHEETGVAGVVLDEGDDVELSLTFTWKVDDCLWTASGNVDQDEDTVVSAALVTTTFRADGTPTVSTGLTAGFSAPLQVKNGVETRILGGDAVAVLLPDGLGTPGAALWPDVSTTVNGIPGKTVAPGERLVVSDKTPASWAGGKDGLILLVVHLRHDPTGTVGVQDDVLGFAVEA